jgi:predicted class III extradiol MEMO1 family dioxygenase
LIPRGVWRAEGAHGQFNIAGAVFPCPDATYTVQSGTINEVLQRVQSHSGNQMFTVTDTPNHVVMVDQQGATYTMRGATWFGGVTIDNTGAELITATHNLEIIARGRGVVDSIRLVERIRNGEFISHDFGTCQLP